MRRIDKLLAESVPQPEVLRAARAQLAMARWDSVVGPVLSEKSWPDRFSKGTVWVATRGSAWAQELRMRKREILRRLNELAAEAGLFEDVRFGVRPLPERASELPQKREPDGPPSLTIREIADKWIRKLTHEDRA